MQLSRFSLLCNTHVQTSLTEEQLKSGEMNQVLKKCEHGGSKERGEGERGREREPVYVPLVGMQNVHLLLVFYDWMDTHTCTHQFAL